MASSWVTMKPRFHLCNGRINISSRPAEVMMVSAGVGGRRSHGEIPPGSQQRPAPGRGPPSLCPAAAGARPAGRAGQGNRPAARCEHLLGPGPAQRGWSPAGFPRRGPAPQPHLLPAPNPEEKRAFPGLNGRKYMRTTSWPRS
ncbi:bcl-2-binding component 3, isoforms 3/4-like [Prinia subflava]|uniref:bcl-2-binding component 3, isoforms 3/4-like n=1 Tax=Prinia subflava TaxID=208062 RepID=UPI002FE3458F